MEEIEYKLKQNNAILIVQAISKLVEIVKLKKSSSESKDKNFSDVNILELQILKSKCGVEDPKISITACHGLVSLVEDGILSTGATLSDLIVILSSAKSHTGITNAIGSLLLLDLRRGLEIQKNYKCPFQIQKQQHPLITVLIQNKDIWPEIFNQIQVFLNHYDDRIAVNSVELLRPVIFYILCDPSSKLRDTSRQQIWNLLSSKNNSQITLLSFEILSWMQCTSRQQCIELRDFLIEISASKNKELCTSIILYLTSLTHKLVKYGCDPNPNISTIIEILKSSPNYQSHSTILFILSDTITICPPTYLPDILRLCKIIISQKSSNIFAVKSIISSLLQWTFYPSNLLSDSLKIINEIISFTEKNRRYSASSSILNCDIYFKYIQFSDSKLDLAVKLCLLSEKLQINENYLSNWLDEVINASIKFLQKISSFLCGIFVNQFNDYRITQKILNILLKLVDNQPEFSFNVLVLILYKLSKERNPDLQLELLKAVPVMAISKQNIPLIVNTLEIFKNEQNVTFKILCFQLYLKLWIIEVRCYPYLEKLLLENEANLQLGIAKASILKEICVLRPELHGREMVIYLSQTLNKYKDGFGSIPSSLALEGITILCENGIVDIVSTWKNIEPRFAQDTRPTVIKSLCKFLSEFSKIKSDYSDYEKIIDDIICKLWNYVISSEYIEIIEASLEALSCFNAEQMTLKHLPDVCRQNLKRQHAKNTKDDAEPEDLLLYIPGECWIQLLQIINHDALDAAGNFLIKWVQNEIAEYKSGIYRVPEGRTEPLNYDYLPDKSIVRALGTYIRLVNIPNSKYYFSQQIVNQCLRVLSQQYSKPLPPLDWHFLLDLFDKKVETLNLCINLLCKQILISGSALKILDNYISDFTPNLEKVEEMLTLFANLKYLLKSIQPTTLEPMITNSLKFAVSDENIFKTLVKYLKNALIDHDIPEVNRLLLGQIIETFTEDCLYENDKNFDTFLMCIIEAPTQYIERLSSPSLWWEITDGIKFQTAVKIRCELAKKDINKPFVFLNECINIAATILSVQVYTLKNILKVFRFHCKHSTVSDWILELMGKIQEKLTKEDTNVAFLCDVFLVAIIIFSEHDFLNPETEIIATTIEARLDLFPNALYCFIVDRYPSIASQIIEWLHHMIENEGVPYIYKMVFYRSLIILRHENAFCESSKWMKYVSVKRPTC